MIELSMIGAAMKVAYWVLQFLVAAPEPVVLPEPTQTQFQIAFPSIPVDPETGNPITH